MQVWICCVGQYIITVQKYTFRFVVLNQEYKEVVDKGDPHILLDVRQPVELEICSLPNSLSILWTKRIFCLLVL